MSSFPELHFPTLKPTLQILHLFTQIVGKVRLSKMPWINHQWHTTLYVSSRGLTTGSVPCKDGLFEIEFDFVDHRLHIRKSDGQSGSIPLQSGSVADFYNALFKEFEQLNLDISIHGSPNEMEPAVPFHSDTDFREYYDAHARTYWQALCEVHKVFTAFRAKFKGKCSPVHFFWGAFDLAVTRFSGRPAPKHPGGAPNMPNEIMAEAYSDELCSCGFWPGSDDMPEPMFYSYCYPTPKGYGKEPVKPDAAFYSEEMGEFFLPYRAVQSSASPVQTLMAFLDSTYDAAAKTLEWNRDRLDFAGRPEVDQAE